MFNKQQIGTRYRQDGYKWGHEKRKIKGGIGKQLLSCNCFLTRLAFALKVVCCQPLITCLRVVSWP